jgi:2,3-bisphosphoglycerate-dependent phosphoglycerate mutase
MRLVWTILVSWLVLHAGASTALSQKAVYLARHAEKAESLADPPLSQAGVERSKALARLLKNADIRAIYVSDTRRTQETAQPLATCLGLSPVVVPMGDPGKTFDKIRADQPNDVVLIIGHTNTINELIMKWEPTAAVTLAESEFDKIFIVIPEGTSKAGWSRFRYGADD